MSKAYKPIMERLAGMPIGHGYGSRLLREYYRHMVGGVSWPSAKMPGFCVVLGLSRMRDRGVHNIFLLDEFKSPDTRSLVAQMGGMQVKYEIDRWMGDTDNLPAVKIKNEWNMRNTTPEDDEGYIMVSRSPVVDMDTPYQYILPQIQQMLGRDSRQLFLKKGEVTNYMAGIQNSQMSAYKMGDIPPIEALGFAMVAMTKHIEHCTGDREFIPGPKKPMSPFAY